MGLWWALLAVMCLGLIGMCLILLDPLAASVAGVICLGCVHEMARRTS